ncbi:hypothetical protein [Spongiivirga citrea]|uniref:Uncharacterized protein n=1 Tax=Spongiivirga citrea TaxID=1481457 RepID=A0A6M0CID1_9FLAO|nr:hypothetical protein [Spongiivirga citrea]NER17655.1 hypothetical protein [Spongiivirga citrea]
MNLSSSLIVVFSFVTMVSVAQKKRKIDTTYAYQTTVMKSVAILQTQSIQKDKFYLNSRSNALVKGGKNRVLLPVNIPNNTKEWYYVFSASRDEEQITNTLKTFNLAGELSSFIEKKSSLQQSVSSLNAPPGANICDIYVVDESNALLFKDKDDFAYDLSSSRENYKSGIVTVKKKSRNAVFLALNNPDNLYGIHIAIEIIAIVEDIAFKKETIRIPVITYSN